MAITTIGPGMLAPVSVTSGTIQAIALDTLSDNGTGAFQIPSGTTAQRPAGATVGSTRWNTTLGCMEVFIGGSSWQNISSTSYTVTGSVYTSGDQTIAGTKTFSSTITGSVSGNAGTAGGLAIATGRNNAANQIVRTDATGYIQCGYINSSNGDENNASNPPRVWGTNGSDNYMRTYQVGSLSVGTAANATYLSATQQTSAITGAQSSMTMSADSTAKGGFICRATGTGDSNLAGMTFWNDAYAIKLGIRADGYFGLGGWSRAAWSWYSDPSGNMVAAGNVTAYSDPRLKENFQRIVNPLDIVDQLDGGTFTWKAGIEHIAIKAGKRDYGILADQVEAVMPELVYESIDINGVRYKTVAYEKLIPVLLESVKLLRSELTDIKKHIGL